MASCVSNKFYSAADLTRIDCYPERLGGIDLVNKSKCQSRSCTFSPTESEDPDCFFPQQGYGYRVEGDPKISDTGMVVDLRWLGIAPFRGAIRDIVFRVQYHGEDALRFSVSLLKYIYIYSIVHNILRYTRYIIFVICFTSDFFMELVLNPGIHGGCG